MDAQAEPLPFPDNSFDLVTCLETVEHVEQPERLLAEALRILVPGGLIYVTTPSRKHPNDSDPTHINIQPRKGWLQLMAQLGFRSIPWASQRAFRAAIFRMHFEDPFLGAAATRLRLNRIGVLGKLVIATYRTQAVFRIGHPGTRILATK